jgi:hypothetical protein
MKDIAHLIAEYVNNDTSLDGLELKEMYFKKIRLDCNSVRESLKKLISSHIQNNVQPEHNELKIDPLCVYGTSKVTLIETSKSRVLDLKQLEKLENDIYTYSTPERLSYLTVTDGACKNLICNAIIPLDLKWRLDWSNVDKGYVIVVSWAHWVEK